MDLIEIIEGSGKRCKIPKNAGLVVAVSGGVDSVVLLHLLLPLSAKYNWKLIVAHFDHGLRSESKNDAKWVRELTKSLGLQFVKSSGSVRQYAKTQKFTIEEAGRKLRYEFLQKTMKHNHAEVIVTAHTADDQAETVTMNFLRGALVRGSVGMREYENNIWRPLLGVSKMELKNFAKKFKIKWREDASNQELNYTRNQIRHKILPVLRKINPRLNNVLSDNAKIFAQIEDILTDWTTSLFKKIVIKKTAEKIDFRANSFLKLPEFFQHELILHVVDLLKGDHQGFKNIHIIEMRKVLDSAKISSYKQLPSKLWLIKTYDKISVSRIRPKGAKNEN